jgi:hypothetical protein
MNGIISDGITFRRNGMETKNSPVLSQSSELKIGKVTYVINTFFKPNGRETAEEKLLNYVSNCVSVELKNDIETKK